jgi:hypothetical protein
VAAQSGTRACTRACDVPLHQRDPVLAPMSAHSSKLAHSCERVTHALTDRRHVRVHAPCLTCCPFTHAKEYTQVKPSTDRTVEWEEEFSYDCTGSAGATSAPCACMHAHVRPLSTPRWRFPTDTTCKKYAHTVSTSSPSMAEPRRNFARRRRTQQTSQTTGCAHTRAHTDTNGHIHVHSRLTKSVWMQFAQSSLALLRLSLRTEKVLVCACASGIGSRIFSARTDNAAASESPIATACACLRI